MRVPKDPAPAGMRDAVARSAAQAWQRPVTPFYLGRSFRSKVRFRVPGLRWDGTPTGDHPVRRFFVRLPIRLVKLILFVPAAVYVLIWIAIQSVIDNVWGVVDVSSGTSWWFRDVDVRASSPMTEAVPCGHALFRARGHVWLVTAPSIVAVVQFDGGQQQLLWSSAGRPPPMMQPKRFGLIWPDESRIDINWIGKEYRLHHPRG